MTKTSKIVYFLVSIVFFIIFDLYFSELIIDSLKTSVAKNPVFDLVYVQNTGAAFSILENYKIFLIIFALFAAGSIIIYLIKNIEKFSVFACFWTSVLISGICCNMYERIVYGYVRDFFSLNFIEFPVFNISDVFINIGVFAIIIIIIKNKYLKNENNSR